MTSNTTSNPTSNTTSNPTRPYSSRLNYIDANLALFPADFTLKCDDGDVACREVIIRARCPELYALMTTRPDLSERVLYLRGKRVAVVARFIVCLEYDRLELDGLAIEFVVALAQLADEFDADEIDVRVRRHLCELLVNPVNTAVIFELCENTTPDLCLVAESAMQQMVKIARGAISSYRCALCGEYCKDPPEVKHCTKMRRQSSAHSYQYCNGELRLCADTRLDLDALSAVSKTRVLNRIFSPLGSK
jgi:hypothetical protein